MQLWTRGWVIYSLISSPELNQASKKTKQKSNPRGHLLRFKKKEKSPAELFWLVLPVNSKHYLWGSLAWMVGTRGAILSSKQGVAWAPSQRTWFIHFRLYYVSSGLSAYQKSIIRWFRRSFRKYHSYFDIDYSPLSGPNWFASPSKPQSSSSSFLSSCVIIRMEIRSRKRDFPAPSARVSDGDLHS